MQDAFIERLNDQCGDGKHVHLGGDRCECGAMQYCSVRVYPEGQWPGTTPPAAADCPPAARGIGHHARGTRDSAADRLRCSSEACSSRVLGLLRRGSPYCFLHRTRAACRTPRTACAVRRRSRSRPLSSRRIRAGHRVDIIGAQRSSERRSGHRARGWRSRSCRVAASTSRSAPSAGRSSSVP